MYLRTTTSIESFCISRATHEFVVEVSLDNINWWPVVEDTLPMPEHDCSDTRFYPLGPAVVTFKYARFTARSYLGTFGAALSFIMPRQTGT